MAYIYNGVETKCGFYFCHKPLVQSDKAGRVKKYCDATCRKAAHRMEAARIEDARIQAERRAAFVARVSGTPESIWPMLADLETVYGQLVTERVARIVRAAIAEGTNAGELLHTR